MPDNLAGIFSDFFSNVILNILKKREVKKKQGKQVLAQFRAKFFFPIGEKMLRKAFRLVQKQMLTFFIFHDYKFFRTKWP